MAITQAVCTSFKAELLGGFHDMDTNAIKMALYVSAATLDATTTAYSATNEASGAGYSAGGNTLSGAAITTSGTTAILDFSDTSWSSASFTARGSLTYNSSSANRACFVNDFGSDKTVSSGTFTVVFPTADASNAILRLA